MKISVVAIGDELLLGQVTDTNSGFFARTVALQGWEMAGVQIVADDASAIEDAIERAFAQAPVVLTTGGLGPTKDDITKGVLIHVFGGELHFDQSVADNVAQVMAKRGLAVNALTAAQAMVPTSCSVIQNTLGTAPLMWFDSPRGVLVAMPGVPFEATGMFETEVWGRLQRRFPSAERRSHSTFIVTGISESALAERLAKWEEDLPDGYHLAYLPNAGYIRLRLDVCGADSETFDEEVATRCSTLRELLADNYIASGDYTPAQILLHRAGMNGMKIATAESCTGGGIAKAITSVPGASDTFVGGLVAYSSEVKVKALGVDGSVIEKYGVVSEEVAAAMAEAACRLFCADIGISTTGIAGPGGGTDAHPVGTVCIAVAINGKCTSVTTAHFPGGRQRVVDRAVSQSLLMAEKLLP